MPEKRKQYANEFKSEAVGLVTEQGSTLFKAARDLSLNVNVLRYWKRESE